MTQQPIPLNDNTAYDFSDYIVYIDESGDTSLKSIDENYPVFVLALCVFHKEHYSEKVVPALEKFKFKHFGHDQIILHENEIRRRKGAFKHLNTHDKQQQFIQELTDIIDTSNFIIISTAIDKRALQKNDTKDNAYHIALKMCIESLYDFLIEKQQQEKLTHIVVEKRGAKEDNDLELEFRRIRDGYNKCNRLLPFDIIFSDKKAMSSGLQCADLVARPIGLKTINPEQPNKAFEILKEKFLCAGGRSNAGAAYQEIGMKTYPHKSEKPR
ncbi:MAG: DUF3800 domain-containing protein [Pasteurella sp.]|nr:DUF3800 domain-containing protein [Pasteurella sp.]